MLISPRNALVMVRFGMRSLSFHSSSIEGKPTNTSLTRPEPTLASASCPSGDLSSGSNEYHKPMLSDLTARLLFETRASGQLGSCAHAAGCNVVRSTAASRTKSAYTEKFP